LQDIVIIDLEMERVIAGVFLEHIIMNIIAEAEKTMALRLTSWTNYFPSIIDNR